MTCCNLHAVKVEFMLTIYSVLLDPFPRASLRQRAILANHTINYMYTTKYNYLYFFSECHDHFRKQMRSSFLLKRVKKVTTLR